MEPGLPYRMDDYTRAYVFVPMPENLGTDLRHADNKEELRQARDRRIEYLDNYVKHGYTPLHGTTQVDIHGKHRAFQIMYKPNLVNNEQRAPGPAVNPMGGTRKNKRTKRSKKSRANRH